MQINDRTIKPTYRTKNITSQSQIKQPYKTYQASLPINSDVKECISRITLKMSNAKVQTLHPPFFQKTLTKFRAESFSHSLKKKIAQKLSNQKSFKDGLNTLEQFIDNFDQQFIDVYIEQIRQPYIRKIFNQGYQIDKVNFKKLNSQYQLRKQIQQVLNETSEWLIQIELLQDILSRIQLYFDIPYKSIKEKLKNGGAQDKKGTWPEYLVSLLRRTSSYALRKSAKIVQNSSYAACISPAFMMLTWAIIGGNANLPFQGGFDYKTLIFPVIAYTIPYLLDNVAENIERKDFQLMLVNWAVQFSSTNASIRHFNEMLLKQINDCTSSLSFQQFTLHRTNLLKYIENLTGDVEKVSNFDEESFEQMRQRTNAYFTKYVQIIEDQWITVMTPEQYQQYKQQDKQNK